MKNPYLHAMIERLRNHAARVEQHFGQLSNAQLNWKTNPESWSVAQCLDHLITSNAGYFPTFRAIGTGQAKMGFWARISPLSGFFGDMLLRETGPQVKRKMKAPKVFAPSSSQLDTGILARFQQQQKELIELLLATDVVGHEGFKIPSPVTGMITYRLDFAVQIIVQHEERHIIQALNVMQHPGFPKG